MESRKKGGMKEGEGGTRCGRPCFCKKQREVGMKKKVHRVQLVATVVVECYHRQFVSSVKAKVEKIENQVKKKKQQSTVEEMAFELMSWIPYPRVSRNRETKYMKMIELH